MLLVKYEKFDIVAKDDYIEEMLFKYEKNVGHLQTFDKKGRTLLVEMAECISENNSVVAEALPQLEDMYKPMVEIAGKLSQLRVNQEFIQKTLSEAVNKKL